MQQVVEAEASEMREPRWERTLCGALCAINHGAEDLLSCRKGQGLKVDLARYLDLYPTEGHKGITRICIERNLLVV